MATPNEPQPAPAGHTYQVTHFARPADNQGGWHQITSAELSAADAIGFIYDEDLAVSEQLAAAQLAATPADPTTAPASDGATTDAGGDQAGDRSGPLPGVS